VPKKKNLQPAPREHASQTRQTLVDVPAQENVGMPAVGVAELAEDVCQGAPIRLALRGCATGRVGICACTLNALVTCCQG